MLILQNKLSLNKQGIIDMRPGQYLSDVIKAINALSEDKKPTFEKPITINFYNHNKTMNWDNYTELVHVPEHVYLNFVGAMDAYNNENFETNSYSIDKMFLGFSFERDSFAFSGLSADISLIPLSQRFSNIINVDTLVEIDSITYDDLLDKEYPFIAVKETMQFYLVKENDSKIGVNISLQNCCFKKYTISLAMEFVNCQGTNFSNANCQDADFMGANCQEADFKGANCKNAFFLDANCQETNFSNANCQNAEFSNANCQETNFSNANLQNAILVNAFTAQGAFFSGANCQGTMFESTNLQGANFLKANLHKANFETANCQGANFQFADLQETNLYSTQLQDAMFTNANCKNTKFSSADCQRTDFRFSICENANFEYVNFHNAYFEDANLQGANFESTSCQGTDFGGANLQGANFHSIFTIQEANFKNANLTNLLNLPNRIDTKEKFIAECGVDNVNAQTIWIDETSILD